MRIAIQEDMLPGDSALEQCEAARAAGLDGIEFWAEGLGARVPEIAAALQQTGMRASAVNLGRRDGAISPDREEREAAISALREALADASDIGAGHVIFVPHYGEARMPDLMPYRSPVELAGEMMIWLLRTVSDLAYAIGLELDMQPRCQADTHFMNKVGQAAFIRKKIKEHPHIKIAPHLYHMACEEGDVAAALRQYCGGIGYINVADDNGGLPGTGRLDFAAVGAALRDGGYDGWLALSCGAPGDNAPQAARFMADLPSALAILRAI